MVHEVIIVGGGLAGLTAGAYLSRSDHSPVIFEKEAKCGGLVNSFQRDGFVYDGGIRATEDSNILFPMLDQLGLELEFIKNEITLGIEDKVIRIKSEEDIHQYQELLDSFYPESKEDIGEIIRQIQIIMDYMDVQYGIKNPAFLDVKKDWDYFLKAVLPWMVKYALTVPKINQYNQNVEEFLSGLTNNQALIDIICQHFFTETPAFFALSYLKVYLDYYYPRGGTGKLTERLREFILQNHGAICNNTRITAVDPVRRTVTDESGRDYSYKQLIWAADQNSLYDIINLEEIPAGKGREAILERRTELVDKLGNDSVLTLYLAVDMDPSYFSRIASEHFFYSPSRAGESAAGPVPDLEDRSGLETWLEKFLDYSTYEISIPVLRDPALAPEGKTGLIISLLFDYHLTKSVQDQGWYENFKSLCRDQMVKVLDESIYPGISDQIIHQFVSTPITLALKTANTHGAITGWSFANRSLPVESRLPKIFSATDTPIQNVWQAGQWTYSPSGLPIAILTGKLAADQVIKHLK
jgi:phytoene dehydrogenase-like protein